MKTLLVFIRKEIAFIIFLLATQIIYAQTVALENIESLNINNAIKRNDADIDKNIFNSNNNTSIKLFVKIGKHKMGYSDSTGKEIIPCIFNYCEDFKNNGYAKIMLNGKFGVINKTGNLVIKNEWDDVEISDLISIIAVKQNKNWGFIDTTGKVVIPISYGFYRVVSSNLIKLQLGDKTIGLNRHGEIAIPMIYDNFMAFTNGLAAVKQNGKWGFINEEQKVIIPIEFDMVNSFYEGMAVVQKKNKWGCINTNGEIIIPLKYYEIDDFSEGLTTVYKEENVCGIMNKKGEKITSFDYEYISGFFNGVAIVENKKNLYGLMDARGQIIVPCMYSDIDDNNEDLFTVTLNDKKGCIDKTGKIIIPIVYEELRTFSEDLAVFKMRTLFGYLNKKGEIVVPAIYRGANNFENGIASVREYDRWGCINKTGKVILPFVFEEMKEFPPISSGRSVKYDNRNDLIDFFGNLLVGEKNKTIKINNQYKESVKIAISYFDFNERKTLSKGWYVVPSNEVNFLQLADYTQNCYYYCITETGKYTDTVSDSYYNYKTIPIRTENFKIDAYSDQEELKKPFKLIKGNDININPNTPFVSTKDVIVKNGTTFYDINICFAWYDDAIKDWRTIGWYIIKHHEEFKASFGIAYDKLYYYATLSNGAYSKGDKPLFIETKAAFSYKEADKKGSKVEFSKIYDRVLELGSWGWVSNYIQISNGKSFPLSCALAVYDPVIKDYLLIGWYSLKPKETRKMDWGRPIEGYDVYYFFEGNNQQFRDKGITLELERESKVFGIENIGNGFKYFSNSSTGKRKVTFHQGSDLFGIAQMSIGYSGYDDVAYVYLDGVKRINDSH